jgi:hypothetical protein
VTIDLGFVVDHHKLSVQQGVDADKDRPMPSGEREMFAACCLPICP